MKLEIQSNFVSELPADPNETNIPRQVEGACFSYVLPKVPSNPSLLHACEEVAELVGLSKEDIASDDFLNVFSGSRIYPGTRPYAMSYAGHQFGNWAGQLGDGRAINLSEVFYQQQLLTLQLKGAGPTPYSRTADGLAVLRSSIREYLCAEAMHHLGVPTTRSLSLMLTGDMVLRDMLYNGNPAYEKGAVVCRLAASFIRFGNFELLASRNDIKNLTALADYTIKHYFPEINSKGSQKYVQFFETVGLRTMDMIVHWQRVGFVHGVMNTDNMSIHGLTIDYGPYGWLEGYDPNWTPNTTDRQQRRYRFGNQPNIALWNLYQLANALFPLVGEAKPLENLLNEFAQYFQGEYDKMMQAKLGLGISKETDRLLIESLIELLQLVEIDMTIFYRLLADVLKTDSPQMALDKIAEAFYETTEVGQNNWRSWLGHYIERINEESSSDDQRRQSMNGVNPKYVLRNYMAQLAIEAAEADDYSLLAELFELLKHPYDEQQNFQKWFAKRPDWARDKVGSSMLSCSS